MVDSHEAGISAPANSKLEGPIKPLVVDIRKRPGSSSFYFYQNLRGQLAFCYSPDPPIEGYDLNETSHFLPKIAKRMIDLVPAIKNVDVRRTWRGLYANTKDGNPFFGFDKNYPGLFH